MIFLLAFHDFSLIFIYIIELEYFKTQILHLNGQFWLYVHTRVLMTEKRNLLAHNKVHMLHTRTKRLA